MRISFHWLMTVFLVLSPLLSFGQLIDNSIGQAFTDQPFFNEKCIKERRIRSISGKEIHYKLGDNLRHTGYFKNYYFNKKGQLIKQLESIQVTKETDTLISIYEYDAQGNLTALRQRDEYGFYAYIYEYDRHGRIVKEEYRRNLTKDRDRSIHFRLGKEFTVFEEKSTYELFEGKRKRIFYNSNGIPYKDKYSYYLKSGHIDKIVEKIRRAKGKKTTQFYYNGDHTLDSMTVQADIAGFQNRKFEFNYDDFGNLIKRKVYKNGAYISQREILYDEDTNLIDDVIKQDIATDFIQVLELRNYRYYSAYD